MLIAIWKLISRERLVLYPAMIGGFVNAWLMPKLLAHLKDIPVLLGYATILWLISVFIQLLVAAIGNKAAHAKSADFGRILWTSLLRFVPAISVLLLLVAGVALLYWLGTVHVVLSILVLFPMFIMALLIQIYPVVYVMTNTSSVQSAITLFIFLRERTRLFIQLALLMLLISLCFILCSSLLSELSASWQSVCSPLLQGFYVVILNYAILITWFMQSKVQEVA